MAEFSFTRPVDKISVAGDKSAKVVRLQFADIDWELPPQTARELAYALMTQADKAENG